jgi:histidine ammonia-lyase
VVTLDRYDALDRALYRRIVFEGKPVLVAPELLRSVDERRAAMLGHLQSGAPGYGVSTGLGYQARHRVAPNEQQALQRAILLGRAVGVGAPYPAEVVRGAMLLRLTGFLSGYAGVSAALCSFLCDRLNEGWTPAVPMGQHGSAGEVIPLSHLFQTLVGEGFVMQHGHEVPAREALAAAGIAPYEPGVKEGLALVNGAPFAPALAFAVSERAHVLLDQAAVNAALASELIGASARPFSSRVGRLKGDPGQLRVHQRLLELLDGGNFADRPQAPVSYRVAPQVLGAVADVLGQLDQQLDRELRAVTDSPLFLPAAQAEPEGFYPSGNWHAQTLGFWLDAVAIAFAQLGNLSEKRLHRLLDSRFSGLPDQLAFEATQAGTVVLHKAIVALCAENRMLATPASVNAVDTSLGQEDMQAFASLAGDKLWRLLDNIELVLAYELVGLRQAHALRAKRLPQPLERTMSELAAVVEPIKADRPLGPDVARVRDLIRANRLLG